MLEIQTDEDKGLDEARELALQDGRGEPLSHEPDPDCKFCNGTGREKNGLDTRYCDFCMYN